MDSVNYFQIAEPALTSQRTAQSVVSGYKRERTSEPGCPEIIWKCEKFHVKEAPTTQLLFLEHLSDFKCLCVTIFQVE